MHIRRNTIIVQTLVILALGLLISHLHAERRPDQDQATRAQANQPLSLARKRHCLEAEIQKWQQEAKDLQPIAEILQDFPPLFEQQKYAEAEQVVDRAIKAVGATCPEEPIAAPSAAAPATQGEAPASLQQKMHRLQDLMEPRMTGELGDASDWQPVGRLMQPLSLLMQQHKYVEAEALVDRALTLLNDNQSSALRDSLIAYAALDGSRQQIFVVKPDGTGKTRLTDEGKMNVSPAWSPNGKKIAFVSDRSSSPQIWIMNADGSTPRQLTTEGENEMPTWSPDGKRLTFRSNRSGHSEIWIMNIDGSHQRVLIADPSSLGGPSWQPVFDKR